MASAHRVQIQFDLPYRREPRSDERIRSYLDQGLRIVQMQRLSDQEVMITFEGPPAR